MSKARRDRERGSGPVTVVLVLGVLALVFAAGFTALGAMAGDEGASAQHAADAAALGGAQGVVDGLPTDLLPGFRIPNEIVLLVGGGVCSQNGRVDATRLAAANGARLTSYCYNVYADKVSVSVEMNRTNVDGPKAHASAEAATTFEATSCRLDPGFTIPTAPPTGASPPPVPPVPPTPLTTYVDCGTGPLAVTFLPVLNLFRFNNLVGAFDDVQPRLTA